MKFEKHPRRSRSVGLSTQGLLQLIYILLQGINPLLQLLLAGVLGLIHLLAAAVHHLGVGQGPGLDRLFSLGRVLRS